MQENLSVREGGFRFRGNTIGATVYRGRRLLGTIVTMRESNGRHCYRLGCDNRRHPRTYRGKVKAAQALRAIDELMRRARRGRWSPEALIVEAWDSKPNSVDT